MDVLHLYGGNKPLFIDGIKVVPVTAALKTIKEMI
jgi:hypothetical protein